MENFSRAFFFEGPAYDHDDEFMTGSLNQRGPKTPSKA